MRPDPDRRERRAPEHDPEPEVGGEPLAADQRERGQRPGDAADAHAALSRPTVESLRCEQLEGGDDDEDAERPGEQRLRGVEADDDAELPVAARSP